MYGEGKLKYVTYEGKKMSSEMKGITNLVRNLSWVLGWRQLLAADFPYTLMGVVWASQQPEHLGNFTNF